MNSHTPPRYATILTIFALLLSIGASATWADVLVIGSSKKKATIEGYDGRNIIYYDFDSHKNEEVSRMSVKAFALDKPRKAEVVMMGKPEPQQMMMHGFKNGKFVFQDGKERVEVHAMKVGKITLEKAPMFANEPQAAPEPAQKISNADIQRALSNSGVTPEQKSLLEDYQTISQEYHQFVAESGQLVSRMDSLTGAARIAALEELRHRKEEEQPLKRKMLASQNAVLQALPDILSAPPQDMAVVHTPESSETITMTMPKVGENEILIIDTSIFKQLGSLNDTQKLAIKNYEAAVTTYQETAGQAPPDAVRAAQGQLTVAQRNLFKAFPNVRVQ